MFRFAFVSVALLCLSACAGGYGGLDERSTAVNVVGDLPAPDPVDYATTARGYRLGALDQIKITVYGAEDLTTVATLDQQGGFVMPLVGRLDIGGMLISDAATKVADNLRGRFVREPQVNIELQEARSQTVTIDGAVARPGVYPVLNDLSLQRAIATAQGATEFASLDRIAVFRMIDGQRNAAIFSLRDIREGRYSDPSIYPGDIVVVGEDSGQRSLRNILQAIPVLGIFTPILTN